MVNDGKVESSYVYGNNGSFNSDNKLVTGEEGQAIISSNSKNANKFFEFAANSNVEFGIVDLKGGVSIVTTSHEAEVTSTLPGIVKLFSKLGETGIRQAHSHPSTITNYNESVPSGYYDIKIGNPSSLMPDLSKGKPYGDAGNAVQVRKLKGFENTNFEVYAPGNKTKAVYDGVNKAKIIKY
ncbi:MAG TPA: JAB-like toxin 1 domain-containing protein, partial [Saprospiraceae bacterium]|nr:JAB-like toxin 1 domain-containing protein [Saprospiraceae bacterium]